MRQGLPRAVASLARGAAEHFRDVIAQRQTDHLGGLSLAALGERAEEVAAHAKELDGDPHRAVEVVFTWRLSPSA